MKTASSGRVVTTGYHRDAPDRRDRKMKIPFMARLGLVRSSVDLRASASPVEDQGHIGSCTANATAGAIELLDRVGDSTHWERSRLFLYYFARMERNWEHEDHGAFLRDCMKVANKIGICPEEVWPYNVNRVNDYPGADARSAAAGHALTEYYRIVGVTSTKVRAALNSGCPIVFGAAIYDSFVNVDMMGVITLPKATDKPAGWHAMCAVGYKPGYIIVRNSWGKNWGDNGYCYMPNDYFKESKGLVADVWAIKKPN